jgi:hypothetical protein
MWVAFESATEMRWNEVLGRARISGFATQDDEIRSTPVFPNAAPQYLIISEWLNLQDSTQPEINLDRNRGELANMEAALARFAPIRPEIERATETESCRFSRSYRQGFLRPLPEFGAARLACRVKLLDAQIALARRNRTAAFRALLGASRTARHVGTDQSGSGTQLRAELERDIMATAIQLKLTAPEAGTLARTLGPLPDAREDIGRHVMVFVNSRHVLHQPGLRRRLETIVGADPGGSPSAPIHDALYDLGITRRTMDVKLLEGIVQAADAMPAYPIGQADFAPYRTLTAFTQSEWNPLRSVYRVEAEAVNYPESYLLLRSHREQLARQVSGRAAIVAR